MWTGYEMIFEKQVNMSPFLGLLNTSWQLQCSKNKMNSYVVGIRLKYHDSWGKVYQFRNSNE